MTNDRFKLAVNVVLASALGELQHAQSRKDSFETGKLFAEMSQRDSTLTKLMIAAEDAKIQALNALVDHIDARLEGRK